MRQLNTLIRRELIENKGSIVWLPIIVALTLVGVAIAAMVFSRDVFEINEQGLAAIQGLGIEEQAQIASAVMTALSIPFWAPMSLVIIFYLASALFDERKDRSILFWKSLPVSDAQTVMSKLTVAVLVIPIIYWITLSLTQLMFLLLASVYGSLMGIGLADILWQPQALMVQSLSSLLAALVHGLWVIPIYSWLLLCSAFAPRSPLMVAIAITAIVSLAISLWHLMQDQTWSTFALMGWAIRRLSQGPLPLSFQLNLEPLTVQVGGLDRLSEILGFLGQPSMIIGWLIAIPLIVATVYTRRRATA